MENPARRQSYLHWTLVDEHSIELSKGVICASRLNKDDCRDAAADTIGSIGDVSTLDRAHGFSEVFLSDN